MWGSGPTGSRRIGLAVSSTSTRRTCHVADAEDLIDERRDCPTRKRQRGNVDVAIRVDEQQLERRQRGRRVSSARLRERDEENR